MQTDCSPSTVMASQEQVNTLVRELLPAQGQWNEAACLWLTDHTSRLIEFTDGYLEELSIRLRYQKSKNRGKRWTYE